MAELHQWWLDFYDDDVAEHLLARSGGESVDPTAEFLWERLRLQRGSRVFDQCCGVGNIGLELARRGAEVVGVDAAVKYVDHARASAAACGLSAEFHAADARDFVAPMPCDAAFNWWTGFGGAGSRREDLRMLERVRDSLRPGGLFLLEFLHAPKVWRSFQPGMVRRFASPRGETLLLRESELHAACGTMAQVWTWLRSDGSRQVRRSRMRLYTPPEIADMLVEAGLEPRGFFADVSGASLEVDSDRCIILAERMEGA